MIDLSTSLKPVPPNHPHETMSSHIPHDDASHATLANKSRHLPASLTLTNVHQKQSREKKTSTTNHKQPSNGVMDGLTFTSSFAQTTPIY